MSVNMYNRYFIYSDEQKKEKTEIAKNMSKRFVPGTVVVNGRAKQYTDILRSMDDCRYGDAVIRCEGDIRKLKITNPKQY